jgi:hypothetical protein
MYRSPDLGGVAANREPSEVDQRPGRPSPRLWVGREPTLGCSFSQDRSGRQGKRSAAAANDLESPAEEVQPLNRPVTALESVAIPATMIVLLGFAVWLFLFAHAQSGGTT